MYTLIYIWTGAISRHLVFFTGTYCTCMLTKLYIESFEINYQVIKDLVFDYYSLFNKEAKAIEQKTLSDNHCPLEN